MVEKKAEKYQEDRLQSTVIFQERDNISYLGGRSKDGGKDSLGVILVILGC